MIMKLKEVFLDIFVHFGAEKFVYDEEILEDRSIALEPLKLKSFLGSGS